MTDGDFWANYQPGFRFARSPVGTPEFFEEATAHRYREEPHIPEVVQFERWADRDVLEAGCGIGTDGARFAAAGARYTGLDFSPSAISLARKRFEQDGLQGRFVRGSVTALPFPNAQFDLVYSHGVIHHVEDTDAAIHEFHRVLKPGGAALVMVYHRRSFNYCVTIMLLRRFAVGLLAIPGSAKVISIITGEPMEVLAGHRSLLREHGFRYVLDRQRFLSQNTDGPNNPLSKAYTSAEMSAKLRPAFKDVRTSVRFLNLRIYPGGLRFANTGLARRLETRMGWHLYAEALKPSTSPRGPRSRATAVAATGANRSRE